MMKGYFVCSLVEHEQLGYLPTLWWANTSVNGGVGYAESRLYKHTLADYCSQPDATLLQLLKIVEELQVSNVEKHVQGSEKRTKTVQQFWTDEIKKGQAQRYVSQRLHQLLNIVVRHEYILAHNVQRLDYVKDKQLNTQTTMLEPILHFSNREDGVYYQLRFNDGSPQKWTIQERNVVVLCNEPAWIIIERQVYHLPDINGNTLKPFLKRDEVHIPPAHVRKYFETFVLRVARKATITAEGFTFEVHDQLTGCELTVVNHFMKDAYALQLSFNYEGVGFLHKDASKEKTRLSITPKGDIAVDVYRRNLAAERFFVQTLEDNHWYFDGSLAQPQQDADKYATLDQLTQQRALLVSQGFDIQPIVIEGSTYMLAEPTLNLQAQQMDDQAIRLQGSIVAGMQQYPITVLKSAALAMQRAVSLGDSMALLVPMQWSIWFKPIFALAKTTDDHIVLAKSQYPLLYDLPVSLPDNTNQWQPTQDTHRVSAPKGLRASLRPYQYEGLNWLIHLYQNKLGGCLADDMGLGKTLQTIAALLYAKHQKQNAPSSAPSTPYSVQSDLFAEPILDMDSTPLNALIIMPASLIFNWRAELLKFAPTLSIYTHTGNKRIKSIKHLAAFDIVLTTYHTALKDITVLGKIYWEYIVLDESQQIKNSASKIFQAVNTLTTHHKLSLSGTPIENSLAELWSQMTFINPDLLGTFPVFKQEFMLPIERNPQAPAKQKLKDLIAPYLLRRTKVDVAKDLPELMYQVFYTEMDDAQRDLYEAEKNNARKTIFAQYDENNPSFQMLVLKTLLRLRQIANHPKLFNPQLTDYPSSKFDDIIAHLDTIRRSGHKALLFSQFVAHLQLFEQYLQAQGWAYCLLTGSTPPDQRALQVQQFQNDPSIPFFLLSIRAGGTGLNLTAADYVLIADPWWNPAVEQQAIARAHRIGQKNAVFATQYICKDTIEEKILLLQEKKRNLVADLIENNEKIRFKREDLEYLLT
jgi:hypothetical protein